MEQKRTTNAVRRIEAALSRIENAAAGLRPSKGEDDSRLHETVVKSLHELDRLIEELEK